VAVFFFFIRALFFHRLDESPPFFFSPRSRGHSSLSSPLGRERRCCFLPFFFFFFLHPLVPCVAGAPRPTFFPETRGFSPSFPLLVQWVMGKRFFRFFFSSSSLFCRFLTAFRCFLSSHACKVGEGKGSRPFFFSFAWDLLVGISFSPQRKRKPDVRPFPLFPVTLAGGSSPFS